MITNIIHTERNVRRLMFFTATPLMKAKHVAHPCMFIQELRTQHCNFLNSFFLYSSFLGNRPLALQPLLGFCGNSCAALRGVWSSSAQILLFQVVRHKQGGMEKMCFAVFWGPLGRALPRVQLCSAGDNRESNRKTIVYTTILLA